MINKIKNNKPLKIITSIVKFIISIIIILVVAVIIVQRVTNNKLNLGGYGLYTVVTTSMVPKYNVGDMILAKKVDTNTIKVGDDVVYLGEVDTYKDKIITHQVIQIENTNEGKIFHTKGIANPLEDPVVKESQIYGVVVFKSAILSFLSGLINSPYGFYFLIFVPIVLIVFLEVIDVIGARKKKQG
ncbi:MAG: signal peptidase I [Bacilli bacterium]|nr:signal peptidase I [Bacilli bacterium]